MWVDGELLVNRLPVAAAGVVVDGHRIHPDHREVEEGCHVMDRDRKAEDGVLVDQVGVGGRAVDREAVAAEEDDDRVVWMAAGQPDNLAVDRDSHQVGTCHIVWLHWVMRSPAQFRSLFRVRAKRTATTRTRPTSAKSIMSVSRNRSSSTRSFATRASFSMKRIRLVSELQRSGVVLADSD